MRVPSLSPMLLTSLVALQGCAPDDPLAKSTLTAIEPGSVSEVQIVPTVAQGGGALVVPIRLNNAYGLTIPDGAPPVVTVDSPGASLLTASPTPDTFGVARAEILALPGSQVQVVADGSTGYAWSLAVPAPSVQAIRGASYPDGAPLPSFAADGTGGAAFAGDDDIWWQPSAPGSVAWRTANLPGTIRGMWSTQIDSDGVLDLVAWTEQQVFVMRGWPGGGYAWGTAWDTPSGQIAGVSARDVTGDRLVDLVIGIDELSDARVELLIGDGAWGFEATEPLELTFGISSVVAADEDLDGRPDISMIQSSDGTIRRYTYLEEGWTGGTPTQVSVGNDITMLGGTFHPMADLDGDGDLELIVEGPKGASSQRLIFFSFQNESVIKYEQAYANYYLDVGDMEGNGAADVLAIEDGTLHLTRFNTEGGSYVAQNYSDVSETGPMTIADIDGDALLDMIVFADAPTYFPGALSEGGSTPPGDAECTDKIDNDQDGTTDASDPQCANWQPAAYTWRTFSLNLEDSYAVLDLDQNGSDDIIGYVTDSDGYSLEPWRSDTDEDGNPQLLPGAGYELSGGTPLDLAVCGDLIYSLYEAQNGTTVLTRVDFVNGSDLTQGRATGEVSGSLLACGVLNGEDVAVVSTQSGEWVAYEQSRLEVASSGFVEAVGAIAVANDDVVGCDGDGCAVVAADVDDDGIDEVFRAEAAGLTVEGWGTTVELGDGGTLRVVDADMDGVPEVLLTDAGSQRVLWFSGVIGGVAPPTSWWRDASVTGTAAFADLDMDGLPELLTPNDSGGLSHSPVHP